MSPYVCDCTNVVYMFCVYCIYYYVNKFEARSLFSTSHLTIQHYATHTTDIPRMPHTFNTYHIHSKHVSIMMRQNLITTFFQMFRRGKKLINIPSHFSALDLDKMGF